MGCDSSCCAMLRGRPALGILCFVSFLALKTQAAHRSCSKDLVTRVQTLIDMAPDTKCRSSTLKCFAEEIKVLYEEWKRIDNFNLNAKLHKLAKFFNQPEAACRQCEIFTKQNATMFLSDLKSALQMMNQQFCINRVQSSEN